jgi:glucose dehydrogenase
MPPRQDFRAFGPGAGAADMRPAPAIFVVVAAGLLAAGGSLYAQHATAFDIEDGGYFFALDARTGELLWKASVGGQVNAGPMSYAIGGRQYITIAAGSSLFAYALPQGQ